MKSMTGYGSAEGKVGRGSVFIEVRSINHRFCDITFKTPPRMNRLDPQFRELIKGRVERGKVELFLKERRGIVETRELNVDLELAKRYQKCLKKLQKELGLKNKELNLLEIIDAKELITVIDSNVDYSRYWRDIRGIALSAIEQMDRMRAREGAFLLKDQRKRLGKIAELVDKIGVQSRVSIKRQKEKMKDRDFASDRLDLELATLADKLDIAEELTRLKSHVSQYYRILSGKGALGRQLDFLLQEMNREVNTLGSKASDAKISSYVISAKSELEKLREQIQNIE